MSSLIITQNKYRGLLEGDIIIDKTKIQSIKKSSCKKINTKNQIILPAFINTHTHLGEIIFRGHIKKNISLEGYLDYTERINNILKKNKIKHRKTCILYSLLEYTKWGVSCISTARSWNELKKTSFKCTLGYPLMNSNKLRNYTSKFKLDFEKTYTKYNSNKLTVGIWIHSLNTINKQILEEVTKKIKKNPDIPITIHVDETKLQREKILSDWGDSTIKILHNYGLLNKRINLVHCVWIDKSDIKLISENGANISISPITNLRLKSGLPRLYDFLQHGINVSVATDGLALNDSGSLLYSLKITNQIWKKLKPQTLLDMITINAAKALGLDNKIGSIEAGKQADLIVFDKINLKSENSENIIKSLIRKDLKPRDLLIDGLYEIKDYKFKNLNEKQIFKNFKNMNLKRFMK